VVVFFVTVLLALLSMANRVGAEQVISSATGPVTAIDLGEELGCQVDYNGVGEFFLPGDPDPSCGTSIVVGGQDYGHDGAAFKPVSQSSESGAGTSSSPFLVTTVAEAGGTGIQISQVDSYVVGEAFYKTDISVINTNSSSETVSIFHAADCYLEGSDTGYGYYNSSTGGIYCSATANNVPGSQVEGFVPQEPGSQYLEGFYGLVFQPGEAEQFPDTCECEASVDNGAGLSWRVSVPPGGSATRSLLTTFSPTSSGVATPPAAPAATPAASASSGVLASSSAAPPAPVLGRTANAQTTSGTVLVRLPGSNMFIALGAARSVALGTVIDATDGTVTLTSAKDANGDTETAQFSGGIFRVGQAEGRSQLHGGKLVGPAPSGCGAKAADTRATTSRRGKSRHLWGDGKGNFRSEGTNATATVRGTKWLTEDTCAGTLVRVARGVVSVDDLPHHRTLLLTAPHSFLAHPGKGG
jgi:hypothetical protein